MINILSLLNIYLLVIYILIIKNKNSRVVLSYNWRLRSFADYVQQLEMESLGKIPFKESEFQKNWTSYFWWLWANRTTFIFSINASRNSRTLCRYYCCKR